jgi:1-acyl-sn-glycerol-3-phosphate acyltransferase
VAKADVASWPVFGFLAKLQQTAFISRARGDAAKGRNALGKMLAEGKSLIIFPEGTSTDGSELFPFKSSMFSLALRENADRLLIQPFSLKVDLIDGHGVVTQDDRDLYAWHYKMTTELPEHLWRFANTSGVNITLTFHEPLKAADYADRKMLAKTCHERVSKSLGMPMTQAA